MAPQPESKSDKPLSPSLGRSLYPMRLLGTSACILVAGIYVFHFGTLHAWHIFLLVLVVAYPHLFRSLANRVEAREKYELGACLLDAFVLGSTVYVVGFSQIPALSLLTVALSNGMALGSGSFMCLSALSAIVGMAIPAMLYGIHFAPRNHLLMDTVSGLFLLFYFILFAWVAYKRSILLKESREELRQRKVALEIEKKKSDSLLWALLPESAVAEFEKCGSVGEPYRHDDVTLLVADIHDFRVMLERFEPAAVMAELNHCFKAFDKIVFRQGLEPLKTVGDAYFAVAGGPKPNPNHARDGLKAAAELKRFIDDRREACEASGLPGFVFRIAVHTGPAICGVMQAQKFSFDLYGDTVFEILQMERQGNPGDVVVSEATLTRLEASVPVSAAGALARRTGTALNIFRLNDSEPALSGTSHAPNP